MPAVRRQGPSGIRRPSLTLTTPRGGQPVAFTPLHIPSLWAWWRGDTVVQASNKISQWTDLSGNARHMTQSTAALKPTWEPAFAGMNNQGAVKFSSDGFAVFNFLNMPDMSALTAGEMWLIIKINNDPPASQQVAGFMQCGSAAGSTFFPNTDNSLLDSWGSTTRRSAGDPTPSLATTHAYSVITTGSEWTNYIDGTQLFTDATNTAGFTATPICGGNGADVGMDGRIGEYLVFSEKLIEVYRVRLKAYLAARYAITIA